MYGSGELALGDAYVVSGHAEGILDGHICNLEPLVRVGQADIGMSPGGDTALEVYIHSHGAGLTGLGGDHDNAVSCARTVNGGGGSIFQHLDGLDIVGVEHADDALLNLTVIGLVHGAALYGNAVHDPERIRVARERTNTTNLDLLGCTGNTVGGVHLDTSGQALEGGFDGDGIDFGEVFGFDGAYRADVVALLGGTITDDDHVFKQFTVLFEDDVDGALSGNGNFFRCKSDHGKYENIVLGCLDRVRSVQFCGGAVESAFD